MSSLMMPNGAKNIIINNKTIKTNKSDKVIDKENKPNNKNTKTEESRFWDPRDDPYYEDWGYDWDKWDDYSLQYHGKTTEELLEKIEEMDEAYDAKWHPGGKTNYWSPDAMEERVLGLSTW